jgi:hypothetical protein
MLRNGTASLAAAALLLAASPAQAQWVPRAPSPQAGGLSSHIGVDLGIGLGGASYTRSVLVPTASDYILNFRGVGDPTGSYGVDLGFTVRPGQRLSYSAYATATSRDRNRFYGWGNRTEVSGVSNFHSLDQFRLETGLSARLALGARNEIVGGPFFRQTRTADGFDLDDRPFASPETVGVIRSLEPYGAGTFNQLGFRTDLRLATEGPGAEHDVGIRFYGGGTAYAPAMDMRSPVLSVYGNAKAFLRLPTALDPVLFVGGAVERVFGEAPFQDAAYLGGRNSLRGFEKQRFAGDLGLLGSAELYATAGRVRVRERPITMGFMLLADAGRMYADGVSEGPMHFAAGGGLWFRDEITGTEITVSVADGGAGPRLYVGLGSAFWR